MSKPNVFIVLLNWNRPKLTIACLESIKKIKILNFRLSVIIIDNNSQDDSFVRINKYLSNNTKLDVKFLVNKDNLGFAGGNNIGINYALENNADFVLILNNDVEIESGLIENLLKVANKEKRIAVVTPKIYFAPGFEFHRKRYKKRDRGKVIWAAGGEIDWKNVYGKNRGVDEVDEGQYNKTNQVDFASGACMMVSADYLKKLNGFDEKYFMYLEDTDLCIRVRNLGGKIIYVHDAETWHKIAQSSKIGSDLNDYYITRNRLLFGFKYASIRAQFALIRESIRFLVKGRNAQRLGVKDFYLRKFGKGSMDKVVN